MALGLDQLKDILDQKERKSLEKQLINKAKSCRIKTNGKGLTPSKMASIAISQVFDSEDRLSLAQSLQKQSAEQLEAINNGDLSSIEEILTSQLNVLNAMFIDYSIKLNVLIQDGYLLQESTSEQVEKLSQLVMKLQNQSTKTARTLTDLKKPRQTTFIKKYVNQQLNQLVTDGVISSSQSLGEAKNASMDEISQKTPKQVSQTVETLES